MTCPFISKPCLKMLSRDGARSGVCAIRQKSKDAQPVICCPIRIYADNYTILGLLCAKAFKQKMNLYAGRIAVEQAKKEGGAVAVFGHGWGGELRLPQRKGRGGYFVDWVLAKLNREGELEEFIAAEVQTIDTTGTYRHAREALIEERRIISDTVGLNWENVSKRILPQLIYKGQVLQREDLCKSGLYFICPTPVFDNVIERLGGLDKLPSFANQPASIHFIAYDYQKKSKEADGFIRPLEITKEHHTTIYKIQEAFSSINLPESNVYRDAILRALKN